MNKCNITLIPIQMNGFSYHTTIICSMVVVTTNARVGLFRLKLLDSLPDMIRSALHEWIDKILII